MTYDEAREKLAMYWLELADECLASARSEQTAGRGRFAVNRCYYACFYSASAALLRENLKFTKHAAVRDAVHQRLVHTGQVDAYFGKVYSELFSGRQKSDYGEIVRIDAPAVAQAVESATAFVAEMKRLIGK